MAIISNLGRLLNGVWRQVDLSANTLAVQAIQINGVLLSSTSSGNAGSKLVGDDNSYSFFTPAAATVKGALQGIDTALGAISITPDFSDSAFRVHDNGDATKKMAFEVSAITTGTVRTVTMPDADVDLGKIATAIQKDGSVAFTANQPMGSHKLTGLSAGTTAGDSVRYEQAILASGANDFTADQSMGGHKLTNLADPASSQDAVTLAYMNARLNGLKPKQSVRAAATGNIGSPPAAHGNIDGVTPLVDGDRVLLTAQVDPTENGIYNWHSGNWTRAADFDSISPIDEINGAWVAVQEGTDNAGKVFVQYGIVTTIGTDAINFEVYNPIAGLIGGDMITFAGSTFSVDLATASGLESTNPGNVAGQLRVKLEASNPSLKFTGSNELAAKLDAAGAILSGASGLAVQVDGSTLEISSNALRVKDLGITLAKLAADSVDENKIVSTSFNAAGAIAGGSGSKIAVQVDSSTIEIASNALRVKDAGITAAKLAANTFDQSTITGGTGSAAVVQNAPVVKRVLVAGEAFAANHAFAVRWGAFGGETTGRVYKADTDASSNDKFYVIGMALSTSAVSAGQNITVTTVGEFTIGSLDADLPETGFPLFLDAAGLWQWPAPTAANIAVSRIGMQKDLRTIDVFPVPVGVN